MLPHFLCWQKTNTSKKGIRLHCLINAILKLSTLVKCPDKTYKREEIPSSDVALQYPYLSDIARLLLPVNDEFNILLLFSRDLISAHHELNRLIDSNYMYLPYAQRLPLGWLIL